MNSLKLILTLLFAVIMLSGCGSSSKKTTSNTTDTNTSTTATTPTETNASTTAPTVETNTSTSTTTPAKPVQVLGSTTITTTKGKSIQVDRTAGGFIFHGYEGKIVLLEVYGDTCPHCVEAIPSYNRLQSKYSKDVVIIALESYGTSSNASKQQYTTVLKANTGNMFSFIQSLTGYHREAVPYLMILGRDGDYTYESILANFPESEIETRIQQLL